MGRFGTEIAEIALIPGSGGVFRVECNGTLIFSKKDEGNRFPEYGEISTRIAERRGEWDQPAGGA